jgi:hypothetical protein
VLLKVSYAGAFLAEIGELEEQAKGVGDLVGLPDTEPVDDVPLGSETDGIVMFAGVGGELANAVQAFEQQIPGLLADDRV